MALACEHRLARKHKKNSGLPEVFPLDGKIASGSAPIRPLFILQQIVNARPHNYVPFTIRICKCRGERVTEDVMLYLTESAGGSCLEKHLVVSG